MNQFVNSLLLLLLLQISCAADPRPQALKNPTKAQDSLPPPGPSRNKFSKIIGWPSDLSPRAPEGFSVTRFATGLKSPRNLLVAANGDVFVCLANSERSPSEKLINRISGKAAAEVAGASANTIILYRDRNKDGFPDTSCVFLSGLNQPYGMAIAGGYFYVANTDAIWRYPYQEGTMSVSSAGQRILDLPAGGYNNHWTRNLLFNAAATKLYVSVGSGSNVAEHGMAHEVRRANVLELNPDGSGERIYASGLRNPVGMDWCPGTSVLWTVVNERDGLGDDLVPDYLTGLREGGYYGWPYAYFGQHEDPRLKGKAASYVAKSIVPDFALGAHTASLGLVFYKGRGFPAKYRHGAFIGQHGSWNRSELTGYRVVFVPFRNGRPAGAAVDFLAGFIADPAKGTVYGRPVGVAVTQDGDLLVADDAAGIVWRVHYTGNQFD